jgi:hypothetical protein
MIEFTVDLSEIERLRRLLPEMGPILDEETERSMLEAGMLMTGMVAARTPVNFGTLRASIQFPAGFEVRGTPQSPEYKGVVRAGAQALAGTSPYEYANYVEFGTRPHLPPRAPIELWVMRKFGLEGEEAQRVTDAVRWSIAARGTSQHAMNTYGTKGYRMFQRAWAEGGEASTRRIFEATPARAVERWARMAR